MPETRRAVCVIVCAVLLLASPLVISGNDRKAAGGGDRPAAAASPAAKPAAKPGDKTVSNEELLAAVEQLKNLVTEQTQRLEAQQQKIETLELKISEKERAAASAPAPAPPAAQEQQNGSPTNVEILENQLEAVADSQKELGERVNKMQTDTTAALRTADTKLRQIGNFTFSGDVRMRFEPFHGGGPPTAITPARNRYRIRLRFNANAKFNDEISGGFSLGSGDTNDPISTNQTLGAGFTRKPFFIDRAFVRYDPKWAKPLSFTVGKQAYSWYRTELTWDNDLNPEGLSEAVSWNFKNPVVKRIAFIGFQGPVIEISGSKDTFLYVGQFQTNLNLGSYIKLAPYVGYYNFQNQDPLRAARAAATVGGSSNSNAASTTGTQYESKFGLINTGFKLDFKTPSARFPVTVLFDYVKNTRACDNLVNIPLANRTACNARDDQGYWAEAYIGRRQEPGDFSFGYSYIHIEREATVDAFNFSDLRAPTNIFNHRLIFNYQAYRNIELGFTGLFGRPLVTATSGTKETILKRLQFDVAYRF